jgi:hypothetical protein
VTIVGGANVAGGEVVIDGVTVVAAQNQGTLRTSTAKDKQPTDQICYVYVPSVYELQTTDFKLLDIYHFQYQRNGFLLPFMITVYNNDDGSCSDPVILGVKIPVPTVGAPHQTGQQITIGRVPECHGTADDTADLGRRSIGQDDNGGQVRWHSADSIVPTFDIGLFLPTMIKDGQTLWDLFLNFVINFSTSPLKTLFDNLSAIRQTGTWLTPPSSVMTPPSSAGTHWHDDGVAFNLPNDPDNSNNFGFGDTGIAVIWRDDIPSKPIPIYNLTIDCKKAGVIKDKIMEAAEEMWSFSMPPWSVMDAKGQINVTTPLEPGDWLPLAAKCIEADINNVVRKLLGSSGFSVIFQIQVSGPGLNDNDIQTKDSAGVQTKRPLTTGFSDYVPLKPNSDTNGNPLMLQVKPPLCSQEKYGDGDNQSVSVRLLVSCAIAGCECNDIFKDIPLGPAINFFVKPVLISSIAVFFTGPDCGRRPLFVLPKSTCIPNLESGVHWDMGGINGQPQGQDWLTEMYDIRDNVVAGLTLAKQIMDVVKVFFHPAWLDLLEKLLVTLTRELEFVIDTTGQLDDLGNSVYEQHQGPMSNDTFGRRIEAALLIGPPSDVSGISFKCYTEVNEGGDELTLTVPSGKYIAGFGDLRDFTKHFVIGGKGAVGGIGGGVGGIVVPDFPPDPEGNAHRASGWGGCIASIKVVEG